MTVFLSSGDGKKYRLTAHLPSLALSAALALAAAPLWAQSATAIVAAGADRARILENFGKLPLSFIENQGQADKRIAYYFQSPGHSMYFTHDGHALRLTQGKGEGAKAHTIKVELVDAAAKRIEGRERAPGIVSYFKGPEDRLRPALAGD